MSLYQELEEKKKAAEEMSDLSNNNIYLAIQSFLSLVL